MAWAAVGHRGGRCCGRGFPGLDACRARRVPLPHPRRLQPRYRGHAHRVALPRRGTWVGQDGWEGPTSKRAAYRRNAMAEL